jgi:hypothetical protein
MRLVCALCDLVCEVLPRVPMYSGKGIPDGYGVRMGPDVVCCSGCCRRAVQLFATCNQVVDPPSDDDDEDTGDPDDELDDITDEDEGRWNRDPLA